MEGPRTILMWHMINLKKICSYISWTLHCYIYCWYSWPHNDMWLCCVSFQWMSKMCQIEYSPNPLQQHFHTFSSFFLFCHFPEKNKVRKKKFEYHKALNHRVTLEWNDHFTSCCLILMLFSFIKWNIVSLIRTVLRT